MPFDLRQGLAYFCFLLFFSAVWGQHPGYIQYTVRDGLPSMNIYALDFDVDGVLWMGTDYGMVAFDGEKFSSRDRRHGLPGLEILDFAIEGRRFWLRIYGHGIGVLENGQYKALSLDGIRVPEHELWPFQAPNGGLSLVSHLSGIFFEFEEGKFVSYPRVRARWVDLDGKKHEINYAGHAVDGELVWEGKTFIHNNTFSEGKLYYTNKVGVWRVADGAPELLIKVERNGTRCQEIRVANGKILLGYAEGLTVLSPGDSGYVAEKFFPEFNVQSIGLDHEGSLWLGTHQNGLIQVPDLRLLRYGFEKSSQYYEVETDKKGKVMAGGASSQTLVVEDGEMEMLQFPEEGRGKSMDMVVTEAGDFLQIFDHLLARNGEMRADPLFHGALKAIAEGPGDSVYVSDRIGGLLIVPVEAMLAYTSGRYNVHSSMLEMKSSAAFRRLGDWARDLFRDSATGDLWGVGEAGVFRYRNGVRENWGMKEAEIAHLDAAEGGPVIFCSGAQGIFYENGKEIVAWPLDFGPEAPAIQNVYAETPTRTWLASRKGIYLVEGKPGDPNAKILSLTDIFGLPFQMVNDICVAGNAVWAATGEGLYQFPQELLLREVPPPLLQPVVLRSEDTVLAGGVAVPYGELLTVNFQGISYLEAGQLRYEYWLKGRDTAWRRTDANQLYFANLAPGDYTLLLRAVKKSGAASAVQRVSFTIASPFWKEIWFLVLAILVAIGLLAGLVLATVAIRRRKETRQQYIVELERKALRAQMNPHFLFNALNSLHVYIGNSEKRKAHLFLSKFARLTRMVLTASEESAVSLASELEAARTFLDLESLRHEGRFGYEISVEIPGSLEKISVPSLLIQPFLENALLHGVRHLQGRRGHILLQVSGETELVITIQDNGIGREAANQFNAEKQSAYRSRGSQITIERIHLIKGGRFEITDLIDHHHKPAGTRCQIFLPWKPFT